MRVMLVHARYRHRGGEDRVFDIEAALLAERGVEVIPVLADNRDLGDGWLDPGPAAIWSPAAFGRLRRRIRETRPDLMHIHNTFPSLSPSVIDAARAEGLAVVQTLHNYRLLCVNALLARNGTYCEDCLTDPLKWRGVARACYRSHAASAAMALQGVVHRVLGTWQRKVDLFLALSPFARSRFLAAGFAPDRVAVKPNTVPDPGRAAAAWHGRRQGAVYVGRFSPEKGVADLVRAWRQLDQPLTIIGDGPLSGALRSEAPSAVHFTGALSPDEVSRHLRSAALVCVPSTCAENFPMAVAEAMAHGVPVLASDLGAMRDLVVPGSTGALAAPGDASAWSSQARSLLGDLRRLERMGMNARDTYERLYAPGPVIDHLLALYDQVLEIRR